MDKATRIENGVQNLTIDYSTDTNGRILSAAYNETEGFTGNFTYVYDNYGNIIACKLDDGDMAKSILINPNNGAIDTRYDPHDIDDPFSYRARDGFMGIGPLWANNDDGTVYMQGHLVIPNPWGNVSTNGTTTTTTVDTTDKDGGDCENGEDCNSLLGQFAENWTLEQGWIAAKYRFIATGTIYTPKLLISIDLWYELEEQKFATEFFKMVFGEDFEQAVEEMYDREIKEHRDKWYDACIEMFRLRCEEIPRECSEIM